jgi:hypothetical protein
VKADTRIPVGFAVALAILLGYRVVAAYSPRPDRVGREL